MQHIQKSKVFMIKHLMKGMTPFAGALRQILPPARKNQGIVSTWSSTFFKL